MSIILETALLTVEAELFLVFSTVSPWVFLARAEGGAANGHLNLLAVFSAGAQLPPIFSILMSALSAVVDCSV